jgi:hypothetical protein
MAFEKPRITEHKPSPFITPPIIFNDPQVAEQERQRRQEMSLAVSREEAQRDAAYLRALNAPAMPKIPTPSVRQPSLPSGFSDAIDAFDDEILKRGIGISRDKILALGRKRFSELLALDRQARTEQRVIGTNCDFTCWPSVCSTFMNASGLNAGLPRRKTSETWAGAGEDRERAARFSGFGDLWKSTTEPRAVRHIYRFRDAFESLVFGLSMLDRIADDSRVRSKFFSQGKPAGSFSDWLGVLEQAHLSVTLLDPTGSLVRWISNEQTPAPPPLEYAKHLFGLRAPSVEQIKVAAAVWRAFVLGYTNVWDVWNFIGRETRVRTDTVTLEIWRKELVKWYPSIAAFHDQARAAFFEPAASRDSGHLQFNAASHRRFIAANVRWLVNRLSALIAMAVEETLPQSVVARFDDFILCETTSNAQRKATLDARIREKLHGAFPDGGFRFRIDA